MSKRRTFSREFKLEAVRMMDAGKKPATEIAREWGVPRSRLYLWKEQLRKSGGEGAFPGRGKRVISSEGTRADFSANSQLLSSRTARAHMYMNTSSQQGKGTVDDVHSASIRFVARLIFDGYHSAWSVE